MSKTVLVGVDENPTARDAVALGAALASATNDELAVAHVYPLDSFATHGGMGEAAAHPLQQKSLELVRQTIAELAPDARAEAIPAHSVAQGLHSRATYDQAEMIVVGSSHRGTLGRAALGTHATRVIHGAPCAVAVAPRGLGDAEVQLTSIAVAVDGSAEAADALTLARRLAAQTGGSVRLVTVMPPQVAAWDQYHYVPDGLGYELHAREAAERVLTAARPGEQTEIRSGHVAAALVEATQDADLLVMGSRSHGPVSRVLLGGVSDVVVRESHCPVLVVPRSARAEGAAEAAPTAAAAS